MPDYKESTVTGKQWHRFGDVYACNNYSPRRQYIVYGEQVAQEFADGSLQVKKLGGIRKEFAPGDTFTVYAPDGTPLREMSEGELYLALASHAMHVAGLRDAAAPNVRSVGYPMGGITVEKE